MKTTNVDDLEISPWPFSKDSIKLRMPGLALPDEHFMDRRVLAEALPMAEPIVFSSILRELSEYAEAEAARNETHGA